LIAVISACLLGSSLGNDDDGARGLRFRPDQAISGYFETLAASPFIWLDQVSFHKISVGALAFNLPVTKISGVGAAAGKRQRFTQTSSCMVSATQFQSKRELAAWCTHMTAGTPSRAGAARPTLSF
jgi:hypothetical protein